MFSILVALSVFALCIGALRYNRGRLIMLGAAGGLLWSGTALAQVAGLPGAEALPDMIQKFATAVGSHAWTATVSIGLILVAWGVRFGTTESSRPFFHSAKWTLYSSAGVGIATLLANTIAASGFNAPILLGSLMMGLLNAGIIHNPTTSGVADKPVAPSSPSAPSSGFARISLMIFISMTALLASCACFTATSPQYNTPGCAAARGAVDCALKIGVGYVDTLGQKIIDIENSGQGGDMQQAALSALEAQEGAAFQCALAKILGGVQYNKMASAPGAPVRASVKYAKAHLKGKTFVNVPGEYATVTIK